MDVKFKEMRSESKSMTPNMIIGKNGLTEAVLENIKKDLMKNRLLKIKILPALVEAQGKEAVFDEIVEKTGAKVVQKIGFTITLTKRG
jgi:RNA-binding protein